MADGVVAYVCGRRRKGNVNGRYPRIEGVARDRSFHELQWTMRDFIECGGWDWIDWMGGERPMMNLNAIDGVCLFSYPAEPRNDVSPGKRLENLSPFTDVCVCLALKLCKCHWRLYQRQPGNGTILIPLHEKPKGNLGKKAAPRLHRRHGTSVVLDSMLSRRESPRQASRFPRARKSS
ncbi:uncharacterized protein BO80DRAFT_261280 [Aspergillus ibericus CBS 121593]|uniref:Uncharacterized protein n=1 Tax=Aspergillus ibericus CBS 121593 TaxID=1448316 RepID=A0A395GJC7_9EURO|nr:hypothetical protein BO80DRAFT_261280 [Aspergillus ibericus CBS 121593]RAK95559.1 hypothetical protein BO80DRAFT_261280 [Aspergillus ibericus CBS 121593]